MGNLGGGEILVILVVALLVLGPARLPNAARQVGNALGELRRLSSGFQDEMKAAMDDVSLDSGDATGDTAVTSGDPGEAADAEEDRRARSRRLVTGSSEDAETSDEPVADTEPDLGVLNGFDADQAETPDVADDAPS